MSEKLKTYSGKRLTVTFDAGKCQHSAMCVKGLPAVFDPKAKPWVNMEGADEETIAAQVGRCPSGALQFRFEAE